MRNSKLNIVAMTFAVTLGAMAMAAPMHAQASQVPQTCDVVNNTRCTLNSWLDLVRSFFYPSPGPISAY